MIMLSEGPTVDDIVEVVEPDIYVKGEEYKESYNDITGAIENERRLVEKHGGRIAFTGGAKFSSTKLINNVLRVFRMKSGLIWRNLVRNIPWMISVHMRKRLRI